MAKLTDKEIDDAWKELARHPMWKVARLKLVRMLMSGVPGGIDDRALREAVGRQGLARQLLDITDSVSEEDHDRDDTRTYLVRPQPVSPSGSAGARRRRIVGAAG
jgi:hypothetical protein